MIGSIHHWSPDPRCWETILELLGESFGEPLLGLSDASSSVRHRLGLACVEAGPILRQALVEHGVEKSAILAA